MLKCRFGFTLTAGMTILAFGAVHGATAQAAPRDHARMAPRVTAGPAVGPAAGKQVIELDSPAELPTTGSQSHLQSAIAKLHVVYHTTAFTNNDGGECLDGDTNTIPNNGAKVQLWACNGWSNQNWYWSPVPNKPVGYYNIQNGDGWQCLDGDTNTIPNNGAKVQLWACNGQSNQIWAWNGHTLRNVDGSQCLDGDTNTIPNNGAKVQLWACNGWNNQDWTWH